MGLRALAAGRGTWQESCSRRHQAARTRAAPRPRHDPGAAPRGCWYSKSRRRDPAQLIESYPAQTASALPGPDLFIRLATSSLPITDSLPQRHRARPASTRIADPVNRIR